MPQKVGSSSVIDMFFCPTKRDVSSIRSVNYIKLGRQVRVWLMSDMVLIARESKMATARLLFSDRERRVVAIEPIAGIEILDADVQKLTSDESKGGMKGNILEVGGGGGGGEVEEEEDERAGTRKKKKERKTVSPAMSFTGQKRERSTLDDDRKGKSPTQQGKGILSPTELLLMEGTGSSRFKPIRKVKTKEMKRKEEEMVRMDDERKMEEKERAEKKREKKRRASAASIDRSDRINLDDLASELMVEDIPTITSSPSHKTRRKNASKKGKDEVQLTVTKSSNVGRSKSVQPRRSNDDVVDMFDLKSLREELSIGIADDDNGKKAKTKRSVDSGKEMKGKQRKLEEYDLVEIEVDFSSDDERDTSMPSIDENDFVRISADVEVRMLDFFKMTTIFMV